MKNLTYSQKIGVMRILMDLVMADGRVDPRETEFYSAISKALDLDETAKTDVETQNSLLALVALKELDQENKQEFAKLMGQMIVVDKDINYNEVKIYNVVNEFCQMNSDFDADDYPDAIFSCFE